MYHYRYLLAVGLENGEIIFANLMANEGVWSQLMTIHPLYPYRSILKVPNKSIFS